MKTTLPLNPMIHAGRVRASHLIFAALSFVSSAASACPNFLQGLHSESLRKVDPATGQVLFDGDLCALNDRYQRARQALLKQGVNPEMIADARAPRLIDMPTWKAHTNGFLNIFGNYDPRYVYDDPMGNWTVWPGWSAAATYVDQIAEKNYQALAADVSGVTPLDIHWLTEMHVRALAVAEPGIAGKIRTPGSEEVGTAYYRYLAPTVSQIQAVDKNEYMSLLHPGKSLVWFRRTQCFDELSAADKKKFDPHYRLTPLEVFKSAGQDFKGDDGQLHHCGYFVYADAAEVRPQLDHLFADIAQRMNSFAMGRTFIWQTGVTTGPVTPVGSEDPLLIAARAQRWFVSIHPFGGGNGRTSRFFMDYLIESLGLPAPTLASMNDDIVVSESAWARQIGIGVERVVGILEDCATHTHADRCQVSQ